MGEPRIIEVDVAVDDPGKNKTTFQIDPLLALGCGLESDGREPDDPAVLHDELTGRRLIAARRDP